jgi:serine/threonine protein kinase
MGILQHLSDLALRQVVGEGAIAVVGLLRNQFADSSRRLLNALLTANKRAWQAMELALAGPSWWNKVKAAFARQEDQAFAREVQTFLDATPLPEFDGKTKFRLECLRELQQARKKGALTGGTLSPEELSQRAGRWARYADPQALLQAEWQGVQDVSKELETMGCRSLGWLLQQRPHSGMPLLVVAVRYFFRREVEADAELFRGLSFQQLEGLTQAQATGLRDLHHALGQHGQRLEEMLDTLLQAVVETRDAVLDLRAEMQRQGQQLQTETRALHAAVVKMLEERQLHARPVRPRDSLSIQTDQERELVKALLSRYRSLPEAQRQAAPALLNGLGQLQLAVGDAESAQRAFAAVATLTPDRRGQAEARFNAYRAALAGRQYADALAEMQQTLALDPGRFAPFPLDLYEPLRILGAGGFGVTFLCRQKHLGSEVAVKALSREDLERSASDVFREAAALDKLHHRAIIQLRHCGYADAAETRPFVAMEYFDGQTLDQHVQANGPLAWEDFKEVAQLVADALAAAHDKGILHRDVKPANLLLRKGDENWDVRLIDFGLALNQAAINAASTIRQGYGVTGTLDYAAPEQLGKLPGVTIGPPADVYGFARTCCFALFGTPQPGRQHWKGMSPSLGELLDSCMAEAPAERPASFAEVLKRLHSVRGPRRKKTPSGDTPDPEPAPEKPQPRLQVVRGLRRDVEYQLREGPNYLGRAGGPPVEVNLEDQESAEHTQCSRRHAVITCERDALTIEDLGSTNGTYVNRSRVPAGQKCPLAAGDLIQVGSVQLRVAV